MSKAKRKPARFREASGQFKSPAKMVSPSPESTGNQVPNQNYVNHPYAMGLSAGGFLGEMGLGLGFGMMFSNGCYDYMNVLGYPGFGRLYTGTYVVYRWMLQHPTVRLVRSICCGIILASNWEYEKVDKDDDSIKDEWLKAVKKTFNRLRMALLSDFYVRGKDMGWAGGEIIWAWNDENILDITRVKPLAQEYTEVMIDENGNFTGFKNHAPTLLKTTNVPVEIDYPYKAFKYTYDMEHGYHFGRSWLENFRATAWRDWLEASQQIHRIGNKISGTVTIVTSPAGTFPGPPDAQGNPTSISYKKNAETVINALANGSAGAWFPSLGLLPDSKGNLDAMKVLVELAGKSLTNINVVDHSGNSHAIMPILERMKHNEELIFQGGLRSSRTGLEGKHGTKEEAGRHTDTGTYNAAFEDREFAENVQALIDVFLEVNFTPKARGKIRVKCPSLIDTKTDLYRAVLLALMNQPSFAAAFTSSVDVEAMVTTLDMTVKDNEMAAKMMKILEQQLGSGETNTDSKKAAVAPGKDNPEPQGGKPADPPQSQG